MTYCLGIMTKQGLVMASDSRTNAGYDQINVCSKMYSFVQEGERVFVVLCSGNLSLTQSIITLLQRDFDQGTGLRTAATLYDGVRVVGDQVRRVAEMDREPLERDDFKFNVHLLVGGQVRGERPNLYLVYPQGNPMAATEDSPYLQIGECKYGRPILDRGVPLRADDAGRGGEIRAALARLDDALEHHRRPADRPARLRQRRAAHPAAPPLQRGRRRLPRHPHALGAALCKGVMELPDIHFENG